MSNTQRGIWKLGPCKFHFGLPMGFQFSKSWGKVKCFRPQNFCGAGAPQMASSIARLPQNPPQRCSSPSAAFNYGAYFSNYGISAAQKFKKSNSCKNIFSKPGHGNKLNACRLISQSGLHRVNAIRNVQK